MKKFTFSLDRVREWREKQFAIEEARLESLIAQRANVQLRRTVLEKEVEDTRRLVTQAPTVAARELQALDSFLRYAVVERGRISAALAESERRIVDQRSKLLEARRRLELLMKLRDKKWTAWNSELAREIESQAGEAYLAQWNQR
jgi:flagellar export protein FliJ